MKYKVVEPKYDKDGYLNGEKEKIYTEAQILDEYFNFWIESVVSRRPDNFLRILQKACIEDWIVVNWAQEVDEEKNNS